MSGTGEGPDIKKQKTASGGSATSSSGRVVLNVGGTLFTTSKTTLAGSSAYFDSLFSDEWAGGGDGDDGIFIDQDPEAFRVLLSYMRLGKVVASELTPPVLLQAQFLGMERLLQSVRIVARREAFAGKTKKLYHAARTAGVLDSSEQIQKEYAELFTYDNDDCCFGGQERNGVEPDIVASIYCGVKDTEGCSVMTYSTFTGCMNWLHRNRYVMVEEGLVREDELNLPFPSVAYFSRISEPENADNLASTIICHECDMGIIEQREFASFVEIGGFNNPFSLYVDIEAAVGEAGRRPLVGGILSTPALADVHTIRKTNSDKVTLMNWLQQEGYTRREPYLDSIYFPALLEAANRPNPNQICVAVWSRRMRKGDGNAAD
mmetsp:Transcript_13541/g.29406  ORF Transcript_13541/g.29406 Transcript_13541/m.29406 type:complete len:376 (+) Transcript_13541:9-1136(+)